MSGGIFFFLSSFFLSSFAGFLMSNYLRFDWNFRHYYFKGPWDINFGFYFLIGFTFFLFYINLYRRSVRSLLNIFLDIIFICLLSIFINIVVNLQFINIILATYIFRFTIFPVFFSYYNFCNSFFARKGLGAEKTLAMVLLFIPLILMGIDVLLSFFYFLD